MTGAGCFADTQWMAALSKPPELKAIAPMVTWRDPDDGLWTRGGAIELGITAPWTLMMGADALMRRHATDPAALVGGISGLVQDMDGLAGGGYGELPAGHFPAFARHDLPGPGYERSRREPGWAASCPARGPAPRGRPAHLPGRRLVRHLHPGHPRQLHRHARRRPLRSADRSKVWSVLPMKLEGVGPTLGTDPGGGRWEREGALVFDLEANGELRIALISRRGPLSPAARCTSWTELTEPQ